GSFFFQAEDGIRDFHVTGVQTCALPIFEPPLSQQVARLRTAGFSDPQILLFFVLRQVPQHRDRTGQAMSDSRAAEVLRYYELARSEERRVGEECRSGWSREGLRKARPCA